MDFGSLTSTQEKERFEKIVSFFGKRGKLGSFEQKDSSYSGNPKLIINVFSDVIKKHINGNPDFAIIKFPAIEEGIGTKVIKFTEDTQYSMWKILNQETLKNTVQIYPFKVLRKNNEIIRRPNPTKHGHLWKSTSPLLVR